MKTYTKWLLGLYILFTYPAWGTVVTSKPASSSDDWGALHNVGYTGWLNAPDSTATLLQLGKSGGSYYYTKAIRFPNLTIPQGATIDSAELWITNGGNPPNDSAHIKIQVYVYEADNGMQVTDTATWRTAYNARATSGGSIDSADQTPAAGKWSTLGAKYRLLFNQLDSVIQVPISRAGWASGNSITLIVDAMGNSPDSTRTTRSKDDGGSSYDSLWISYTYSPGGGGGGTPNTIVRQSTIRVGLRAPEKMFYRPKENWKW